MQVHTLLLTCIIPFATYTTRLRIIGSFGRSAIVDIRNSMSALILWTPAGTNERWSVLRVWKKGTSSRIEYPAIKTISNCSYKLSHWESRIRFVCVCVCVLTNFIIKIIIHTIFNFKNSTIVFEMIFEKGRNNV